MKKNRYIDKKLFIYNDKHIPFHDDKLDALMLKFLAWYKPDIVCCNGDLVDFYKVSDFDKDPQDEASLNGEISTAHNHIKKVREISGCSEFDYIEGNHEYRFNRYLFRNAKELVCLRRATEAETILSVPYLMELDKLGVSYHKMKGRDAYKNYNGLYVGHYDRVTKHSANTAKALVEDKGVSIVQGHTHRGGTFYKTTYGGNMTGIENFCTCDLNPHYLTNPNWQHGWTVVNLDAQGFYAQPILIEDYEFYFGGKKFSV